MSNIQLNGFALQEKTHRILLELFWSGIFKFWVNIFIVMSLSDQSVQYSASHSTLDIVTYNVDLVHSETIVIFLKDIAVKGEWFHCFAFRSLNSQTYVLPLNKFMLIEMSDIDMY